MRPASRGARLARRYPILNAVPENERPGVVRAALRHPLLLLPAVAVALLLLPLYFEFAFRLTGIAAGPDNIFDLGKVGCVVLVPVIVAVPLLSRFVVPYFIGKEMHKRGFGQK